MNVHWRHEDARLTQYGSYEEYLASEFWRDIRTRVFRKRGASCWCCDKPATSIHHENYSEETLLGDRLDLLYPICHVCHEAIHKGCDLYETNRRLREKHREKVGGHQPKKRDMKPGEYAKRQRRKKRLARSGEANRRWHEKQSRRWRS